MDEGREEKKYFVLDKVTRLCFVNVSNYVGHALFISFILGSSLLQIKGPSKLRTRPTQTAVFLCYPVIVVH